VHAPLANLDRPDAGLKRSRWLVAVSDDEAVTLGVTKSRT